MNEHEDLVRRLAALGLEPVDPDVASRHLSAMTKIPARDRVLHKLRVASAFGLGLLLGATGLASTGALPDPMQEIAHDTLGAVGVDVPAVERYQGEGCPAGAKNHGQYVRSQGKGNRSEAAKKRCGKPVQAGGEAKPEGAGAGAGNGCGKPPWAGKGKPNQAEKETAQAARKAACGDQDENEAENEAKDEAGPSAQGGESGSDEGATSSTTSSTAPSTTSTTLDGDSTTSTTIDATTTTSTTGPVSTTTTTIDADEATTTTTSSNSGTGSSGSGSSGPGS